ncbi:Metallo-dependent phosphatase-like [Phytophthora cactorum]|nr:Metallo-dependent phosphatase-like [Phytophthora cactorum]
MVATRKVIIGVGVLVVIGAIVGIIVAVTGGSDDSDANTSSGETTSSSSGSGTGTSSSKKSSNVTESDLLTNSTASGSGSGNKEPDNRLLGQINIAEILAQAAGDIKPSRIIGHGDNIYWNGAGPDDIDYRMETTFESVYDQPELEGIPWINVVGNHDLGGSEYICGDKDYNFQYKSANSDRWKLSDHYYVESVEENGVSVDIFNIDTNFADSHGVMQICCQCYGYVKKKELSEAEAKKLGNTCNDRTPMYNACADTIKTWWDDSLEQVKKDLAASTATWKRGQDEGVVHDHQGGWGSRWLNGHTHGFNHDISNWGTHFYENGGGGGIQSETSGLPPEVAEKYVEHAWIAAGNPYGFFMLHFSEDWLKTEFVTFDDSWTFSVKKDEIVKGGYQKGHCWHVPVTVGAGKECASSKSAV